MDLAALGLSIDSAGVVRSAGDLDRFAASAVKADKSAQLMVMSANKASAANDTLAGATQRVTGSFMPLATSIDKAAMSDAKLAAEAAKVVAAFGKQESAAQSLKREIDATTSEFLQYASATSRLGQAANVNGGFIGKFGQAATNASFQVQDFAVQIASGQNAMTAFAQQAPQLLGAFGFTGKLALYGSLMGTAVAVTAAVLPLLMSAGEETRSLDEVMGDLADSTDAYVAAVEAAAVPIDELIKKYGDLAYAVRDANLANAEVTLVRGAESLSNSIDKVTADLTALFDQMSNASAAMTPSGWAVQEAAANEFRDELGLVGDDLGRVRDGYDALQGAGSFADQVSAAGDLRATLSDIYGAFADMPAPIQAIYENLDDITKRAADFAVTSDTATTSVWDIFDASDGLAGNFDRANVATGGLLGTLQSAAKAAWDLAGARVSIAQGQVELGTAMDPLGTFSGGQASAMRVQVNAGGTIRTPELPPIPELPKPGSGGGGSRGSSVSKARDREFDPFADLGRSTELLERQIGVVGKSEAEVARLQARWEAFDRIQKEGLKVTPEMTAQIDAQAAQVGTLTQQLNDAEIAWEQFSEGVDTIAQTMADVIVGGESLRESLAGIFKGIAADLLSSGIRNAIMAQFGGMGGGGFNPFALLGNVFGGGDALTGAMRGAGLPALPSFDGGGWTGDGPRSGGVDGKGGFLAVMHSKERVHDTTKGQGAGGVTVIELRLSPEVIASILAEAEGTTIRTVQQSASAQQKALPAMIQRTNAQPRRR